MDIKQHIRGISSFVLYRDSNLWYKTDDTNFEFPVPIEDIGNATFNDTEKSLIMMRYIRKWMQVCNQEV